MCFLYNKFDIIDMIVCLEGEYNMRIDTLNVGCANFGAKVKIPSNCKDIVPFSPLKELKSQLEKSGTENLYELGESTYTNPQRTAGRHEILLNGLKVDELVQNPADGTFGLMKNYLQKCIDKENQIVAQINPEISSKLAQIKDFIKTLGLSVEDAKKWL